MMKDLSGLMTINNQDAWTSYRAWLCEESEEDSTSIDELLRPVEMKEYTTVEYREQNGEELPDDLPTPAYKARDLTLYIAVYGVSLSDYNTRRVALLNALRAGWLNIKLTGLPLTYKVYYKGTTDKPKVYTDVATGETVGMWKVRLREPKPGI
ncbi:MAG: hypothetical protein LBN29_01370 [Mediterranea sp.]|jgi:hypothetical protein|nr:hypothetical protein [Mediterranea sp.]